MIPQRFPALTSRNFQLFLAGQFVSLIGSWMQTTVQPYLAYRLTGEPIYLGLIGFASTIPALLLMLPAGVYVERLDKRKVVIAMQAILMVQAFMLAYLALTGVITIWHIILLALIAGTASSVELTARQAMFIELVDNREALPNAIALNSTIFNTARIIGPTLTAPFLVIFQKQGEGWAFFANGISFLFVIVGLFLITTRSEIKTRKTNGSILQDFKEGQRFIRRSSTIILLIMLVSIMAFFGFPFTQQIPVFASKVLMTANDSGTSMATRNSLLVTAQGVGAFIAAITLALFSNIRRKGRLLAIGQIVFATSLIGLALSRTVFLAMSFMALAGWGTVTQLALTNTLIQLSSPDDLRGRIISTYFWAQQGVAPFGSLLIGGLAQGFGAPVSVAVGGIICLTATVIIHTVRPTLRRMGGNIE
ncbi:MAG: MFS transporter [Anaerolineaceae bacterium]|nr:MFS transporter [Anaerolineaceae bacterium]